MNHFLLAQHMQKKSLIEMPNKQVIELNTNKSDNLVDNFDVNDHIINNKGGGFEFNGLRYNNNANNDNMISVLCGEYESAQKENRSKLIINERQ